MSIAATLRSMMPSDIATLRQEAAVAGDLAQVAICDRAEKGSKRALRECARVIRDAGGLR